MIPRNTVRPAVAAHLAKLAEIMNAQDSAHVLPILARTRCETSLETSPAVLRRACHEMIVNLLSLASVVAKMKDSDMRGARLARAEELFEAASVEMQGLCEKLGEAAQLLGV